MFLIHYYHYVYFFRKPFYEIKKDQHRIFQTMIYSLITIIIISENNINNNITIIILFYCNFLNIINNQLSRFTLWNEI